MKNLSKEQKVKMLNQLLCVLKCNYNEGKPIVISRLLDDFIFSSEFKGFVLNELKNLDRKYQDLYKQSMAFKFKISCEDTVNKDFPMWEPYAFKERLDFIERLLNKTNYDNISLS